MSLNNFWEDSLRSSSTSYKNGHISSAFRSRLPPLRSHVPKQDKTAAAWVPDTTKNVGRKPGSAKSKTIRFGSGSKRVDLQSKEQTDEKNGDRQDRKRRCKIKFPSIRRKRQREENIVENGKIIDEKGETSARAANYLSKIRKSVDVTPDTQKALRKTFRQASSVADSTYKYLKNLIPSVLLLGYSLLSATILYYTEKHVTASLYDDESKNLCLNETGFWGALFYVNTLYTTIGYGNVYACTNVGRIISVIIAVVGIPLVFIVLNGTGRFLSMIMNRICVLCGYLAELVRQKRQGKLVTNELWEGVRDELDDEEPLHVPIYLGVILTIIWTLVCALYFSLTENWNYLRSLYFSSISLMTIGLGDLAPKEHKLSILTFAAIMIGLSLVSMSIKVVQAHIEDLFNQMKIDIIQDDQSSKSSGETEQTTTTEIESDVEKQDGSEVRKIAGRLNQMQHHKTNHGQKYLHALFTERQIEVLDRVYQKKIRMRIRGVQAAVQMESRGTNPQLQDFFKDNKLVNAVPTMADKRCQTEVSEPPVPRSENNLGAKNSLLKQQEASSPDQNRSAGLIKRVRSFKITVPGAGNNQQPPSTG